MVLTKYYAAMLLVLIDPFHDTGFILHPLVFQSFQGVWKETSATKWVKLTLWFNDMKTKYVL